MSVLCLAGPSAGSTYWSIVEGFLSTTVFAYSIYEGVKRASSVDTRGAFDWLLPMLERVGNPPDDTYFIHLWLPPAAFCTGFAVWNTVSANRSENINIRTRRDGFPGFLDVGGLDLLEYYSVTRFARHVVRGFLFWLLFLFDGLLVIVCSLRSCGIFGTYECYRESFLTVSMFSLCMICPLCACCSRWFRGWKEACHTRPGCSIVRGLLAVASTVFAVFVYHSPAPPIWRWSLILTHITRTSRVYASLCGICQSVPEAGEQLEESMA